MDACLNRWRRYRRLLSAAALLSALSACVSTPDPEELQARLDRLTPGQTVSEAGDVLDTRMRRPNLMIRSSDGDMLVFAFIHSIGKVGYHLNSQTTALVFEQGRYIGKLDSGESALGYARCLRQPGGRDLLAQRLRHLCAGKPDPLGQLVPGSSVTQGDQACPSHVPPRTPSPAAPPDSNGGATGFVRGMGESLFLSMGLILSPILVPAGVAAVGGGMAADAPSVHAQKELAPGISGSDVARIMGKPTMTFALEPVGTEVRCYQRIILSEICVGLEQDRVVWFGSGELTDGEYRKRRVWK